MDSKESPPPFKTKRAYTLECGRAVGVNGGKQVTEITEEETTPYYYESDAGSIEPLGQEVDHYK